MTDPPGRGAQRVVLHVGLPKTGTTALQTVMAENRAALAEQGVLYPFIGPEGMLRGATEVLGWSRWGTGEEPADGATEEWQAWPALCARAREHPGTTVISHEILGRARKGRVEAALAPLEGLDVHVVVTARDLARQVTAVWQERVKNGRRYSFEDFLEVEGVLRTGRKERSAAYFWREQDLLGVLWRWGRHLPADHVHVVTCPPAGGDPAELLRRFGTVVGVDLAAHGTGDRGANRSLGLVDTELLRRLNVVLHDRLPHDAYVEVVKRHFTAALLGAPGQQRALAPARLRTPFEEVTEAWAEGLARRGHVVHGDLDDLRALHFAGEGEEGLTVPAEALVARAPALVADLLVEVAELRREQEARTAPPDPALTTGLRPARRVLSRLVAATRRPGRP